MFGVYIPYSYAFLKNNKGPMDLALEKSDERWETIRHWSDFILIFIGKGLFLARVAPTFCNLENISGVGSFDFM